MRQLKGKVAKENSKMKRERKEAFREGHNKALTIALPVLIALAAFIVLFVIIKTSKKATEI